MYVCVCVCVCVHVTLPALQFLSFITVRTTRFTCSVCACRNMTNDLIEPISFKFVSDKAQPGGAWSRNFTAKKSTSLFAARTNFNTGIPFTIGRTNNSMQNIVISEAQTLSLRISTAKSRSTP